MVAVTGVYDVGSGQTDNDDVVDAGGSMFVLSGGTANATTVDPEGSLTISFGGTVSGTVLAADSGGFAVETVSAGGSDLGARLSGGEQNVFGYASGTVEYSADGQRVEAGGTAVGTVLVDAGEQYLGDPNFGTGNGTGIGTTISSGGIQWDGYGGASGTAISTSIYVSGIQIVGAFDGKGMAIATSVFSGGTQTVGNAPTGGKGIASGTTIYSGGTEIVSSGGTTSGEVISGGTLELTSHGAATGGIVFAGSGDTLKIDATTMPTNVLSGLVIGDAIDLANVTFTGTSSATLASGNLLKVVEGGKTYDLHLNPSQNFSADVFAVSADAGSGTSIVVSASPAAPVVLSATSPESGAYGVGRTVTFTLDMSLPANVTGTPTLTLNDGGVATYSGGSGTNDLTFSYTVGSGQNTPQLTTSLSTLAGGTITGLTGTAAGGSNTFKLGTLGVNTSMMSGTTVTLSANTEAALQAAIDTAASGETIKFNPSGKSMTLSSALIIPTGTNITIDGFGEGTGTFDAFALNASQPIIIEQGATADFSYVDVTFKEKLGAVSAGGAGISGANGTAGANGSSPGQSGANGQFGGDGSGGASGASGLSLLGAIENYGTTILDHVSIDADSEAGDGGDGGKGGKGGSGGKGGNGAASQNGGGAGAAGANGGNGGTGGGGGAGGSAIGAILNGASGTLTLEDALVTGTAKGGDGGDGEDGEDGGDGGDGGNGGSGLPYCPGGGAGGNGGDGGNSGDGGQGGNAVGGIDNVGTLNVVGATVLFGDDAEGGGGGKGGATAGTAGTLGHAGTPGTGKPPGASSIAGTAGNAGATGAAGASGASAPDLAGNSPTSGVLTINQHMYEFDPKSLNPATVTLSGTGTKFTYKVDIYGPKSADSVQWEVVSTIPAADFVGGVLPSGTLDFNSSGAGQSISFTLKPDPSQPLNESFTVELVTPTNGDVLGTDSAIVQNVDNLNGDTWKANTVGDWSTVADWTNGLPTSNTQALISAGGVARATSADSPTVAGIATAKGATLDITGGTFVATVGTGNGINAGTIAVGNGATFEVGGKFANTGSITLTGSSSSTLLKLDDATISGGTWKTTGADAVIETVNGTSDAIDGATVVSGSLIEVTAGNTLTLSAGTIGSGATVLATDDGALVVSGTLNNSGTLFASGAGSTIDIAGVVNGGTTEIGDGIVEIGGASKENVAFQSGGTGGLDLADASAYTGKVSGFGENTSQFIDLTNVNSSGATISYKPNSSDTGGVLTVSSGGHSVASINLVGQYTSASFDLGADAGNHLQITDPPVVAQSLTTGTQGASVALLANYIATSFVTNEGYGGTLITEAAQKAIQQPLLVAPHA